MVLVKNTATVEGVGGVFLLCLTRINKYAIIKKRELSPRERLLNAPGKIGSSPFEFGF